MKMIRGLSAAVVSSLITPLVTCDPLVTVTRCEPRVDSSVLAEPAQCCQVLLLCLALADVSAQLQRPGQHSAEVECNWSQPAQATQGCLQPSQCSSSPTHPGNLVTRIRTLQSTFVSALYMMEII